LKKSDLLVIGTGLGSLSSAALLAKQGFNIQILEQNWIPGGCTSSYPRKNYVFETGATTIVGLDENMPLHYLLHELQLSLPFRKLELPMIVDLNGETIHRHQSIDRWIEEVSTHFSGNQQAFWKEAYRISQFVWESSLKFLDFPPTKFSDWLGLISKASLKDFKNVKYALLSTHDVMNRFGVNTDKFRQFVDEQLMITAQNKASEVNFLFGATALCYTNYSNYYLDGGLINLVRPLTEYIISKGCKIEYRNPVLKVHQKNGRYLVETKKGIYESEYLISGIPINNTLEIWHDKSQFSKKLNTLSSPQLNSALQLGVAFKNKKEYKTLHYQIHINRPLAGLHIGSLFLSLSHPKDKIRAHESDITIASISTHFPDPNTNELDTKKIAVKILDILVEKDFLQREDILYWHSSGPKSWQKWTGRSWGFVGGYPQFMKLKPWRLNDVRLDNRKAYQVGDTVYPGQGIPGVTLGGIIAANKLLKDAGITPTAS
jgi:phytoene dehydrogenase-like protein